MTMKMSCVKKSLVSDYKKIGMVIGAVATSLLVLAILAVVVPIMDQTVILAGEGFATIFTVVMICESSEVNKNDPNVLWVSMMAMAIFQGIGGFVGGILLQMSKHSDSLPITNWVIFSSAILMLVNLLVIVPVSVAVMRCKDDAE
jgi:hypothetical protein